MTPPKLKGLGRGLDALLASSSARANEDRQQSLPITSLAPGKYQPRTRMDAESLNELAASIRAQGVMQPILVRPVGERYEIVAGERRWRASQLAGLKEVPVMIREIPDDSALAMALIENIQREDLDPLEEAAGLQRLIDDFGMTHEQAADAVGRSRTGTTNLLRLLKLAEPVQQLVHERALDMGHARALLPLHKADQVALAQRIAQQELSVREAERLVQQALRPPPAKKSREENRDLLRLQEELSDSFGTEVIISANRKGAGKLTIAFGSLEELDGVLASLRKAE